MGRATSILVVAVGAVQFGLACVCHAQPPQDPADALRKMFEQFGQQSEQFMPGMFSELTPQQLAELEKIVISPKEEAQLGTQVLKNYEATLKSQQLSLNRDANDKNIKYLSKLINSMRTNMTNAKRYPRIDVGLVETENIDAYSVPGGHLIFTSGLLEDVQSEAELVGVIGHELSHLDRGHQLLPLKQSKSLDKLNDFRSGMLWVATIAKPFRPEFETQADGDSVRWMLASGYDPRQLAKLLGRWNVRQDQQAGWTKMLPSFARSHPDAGRRAQVILQEFDRSKVDPDSLHIGRENLKRRIPSSERKLAD
jgi:predicted Zn-dependent protease